MSNEKEIHKKRYAAQEKMYSDALQKKTDEIDALKKEIAALRKNEEDDELDQHQRLCYFTLKEEYEKQPGFEELFRDMPKTNAELNAVLTIVREAENTHLKRQLYVANNLASEREKMLERLAPIAELLQQVEQTAAESEQVKRVAQAEIEKYKKSVDDVMDVFREAEKKNADGRRVINRAFNILSEALEHMPLPAYDAFQDFLAQPVTELVRVCRLFPDNTDAKPPAAAVSDSEAQHKRRKV